MPEPAIITNDLTRLFGDFVAVDHSHAVFSARHFAALFIA